MIKKNRIPQIAAKLDDAVDEALAEGARAIAETAKINVPRDSGDLAAAIHVEKVDEGYSVVAGDSDVYYGHMIEYGSVHSSPQPFLTPAYEGHRDNIQRNLRKLVQRMIDRGGMT